MKRLADEDYQSSDSCDEGHLIHGKLDKIREITRSEGGEDGSSDQQQDMQNKDEDQSHPIH